jgi:V/A-type H+/Na+-transporting ATPase subunit I
VLVPMTKAQILGPRDEVERAVTELQLLGRVEIADARTANGVDGVRGDQVRAARRDELHALAARADGLLAELGTAGPARAHTVGRALDLVALRDELQRLSSPVEELRRRLDALRDERLVLPGYLEPLRRLLPLVPELAELDEKDLRHLRLGTIALVLNTEDELVVQTLRGQLSEELAEKFALLSTRIEAGALGCLVVFPYGDREAVRALLGRAQVRHVALPEAFEGLSLHAAVEAIERRLAELPQAVATAEDRLLELSLPHAGRLRDLRVDIAWELERLEAVGRVGTTQRAFIADCWLPRRQFAALREEVEARLGAAVVVEDLAPSARDPEAPVLMRNSRLARPFEPLVSFLELPRAGALDPTLLMALFLPLMFGAMVGDVGYGAVLLAIALFARRMLRARAPLPARVIWVLAAGAVWSIVFGILFGELFGDLGQRLVGDWAVWRYRPAAETLEPLLLLAVAMGAAHVALGLGLGALEAVRFREHRELLDKLGVLLVLAGLFGLAGWAAGHLPAGALTPVVAASVIGLVLVMSLHGALGMVTGPLELIGTLGKVLSYLRIAAVGLASAHLAAVANALATVGPIWMGVLVAIFFHALNVALAAFSPTIQALRLHYVEFFDTFFIGGGRQFTPFGRPLGADSQPTS